MWDGRRETCRDGAPSETETGVLLLGGVAGLRDLPIFMLLSLPEQIVGGGRSGVTFPESLSGGLSVLIFSLSLSSSSPLALVRWDRG